MELVPRAMFLTKGMGRHSEQLTSFELALRDAGIAHVNLVTVSSIFPPNCKLLPKARGAKMLHPGQIVFSVIARMDTHEAFRMTACSIGVAIPGDPKRYGYLSEHHSYGEPEEVAGEYAEDLAASMLATVLGLDFDKGATWDEREEQWKMSGKIVKTINCTQSAQGRAGYWTTVVSCAVLIP